METMDGAGLAGMLRARAVPLDGRERERGEGRGGRGGGEGGGGGGIVLKILVVHSLNHCASVCNRSGWYYYNSTHYRITTATV